MKGIAIAVALTVATAIAYAVYRTVSGTASNEAFDNLTTLLELPPNRWIVYRRGGAEDWTRQGHAGMAYDSDEGTLLVFGSDTHRSNWDNSVHEFQPLQRRWRTHYAASSPDTYRLDAQGHPVAGNAELRPWAMHTYDAVEYDPMRKALVVASTTEHSGPPHEVGRISGHPTWFYYPATGKWEMLGGDAKPSPAFFGGGLAYDDTRDVLIGYRGSIWELGPDRRVWQNTGVTGPHQLHFSMAYDPRRARVFVFGDYRPTCTVWSYAPGSLVGSPGTWETAKPESGSCPRLSSPPVALDRDAGLFLVVEDDPAGPGNKPQKASTYYYDPDRRGYHRLPEADLPPIGMNYMLAWDGRLKVFFLVTGSWDEPTTVWALRLDASRL